MNIPFIFVVVLSWLSPTQKGHIFGIQSKVISSHNGIGSHTVVIPQWLSHSGYYKVVAQWSWQSGHDTVVHSGCYSQADLSFIVQPMGLKDVSVLLMLDIQVGLDSHSVPLLTTLSVFTRRAYN